MKKKLFSFLIVASLACNLFAGCSSSPEKSNETSNTSGSTSTEISSIYEETNQTTSSSSTITTDSSSSEETSLEETSTDVETTTKSESIKETETTKKTENETTKKTETETTKKPENETTTSNTDVTGSDGGTTTGDKNPDKITDSATATASSEEKTLAQGVVNSIITSGMTEFEKAKAIHDYLVINVDYDYANYLNDTIPSYCYTALGALKNKSAVCAGYAKAFELLCSLAGLQCTYVTGNTPQGYHAWNQVRIDGNWYNVDVTWDDPVSLEKVFDDHTYNNYSYFLLSDEVMYKDHTPTKTVNTCSSSLNMKAYEYDIPWLGTTSQKISNEEELRTLIKTIIDNNADSISFIWDKSWSDARNMTPIVSGLMREFVVSDFNIPGCTYYTIKNTNLISGTFKVDKKNGVYTSLPMIRSIDDFKDFITLLSKGTPDQYTVAIANELANDDVYYEIAVWAFDNLDLSIGASETQQYVSSIAKAVHVHAFKNNYHGEHHSNKAYRASSTADILNILGQHFTDYSSFRVVYRYGDELGRLSSSELSDYVEKNFAPIWASSYCYKQYELQTNDFVCVTVIRFSCANHNTANTTWEDAILPTCINKGLCILKCSDCHNIVSSYESEPTGVHDTYWVYDSDTKRHLACKNCTYTGETLEKFGDVWGYFDDTLAMQVFTDTNIKREDAFFIHRDIYGNFISSETPPQLTYDSSLSSTLSTYILELCSSWINKQHPTVPDYILARSLSSEYCGVDILYYSFDALECLNCLTYTKAGTTAFYYDTDNTGLKINCVIAIYYSE